MNMPGRANLTHTSKHDFSKPRFGGNGKASLNDEACPPLNHLSTWQLSLLGILLAIFYGAISLELFASLQVYYLYCLAGLVIMIGRRPLLPFNEAEKTGMLIILVFCLVSIITYWINGMPGKGDIYVQGRYGKYLLAIPVYFFFRAYYIPNRLIFMVAILVAIELFMIALIDLLGPDVFAWQGRASGNTHPIYFAMLCLTMVVIILAFRDEWSVKKWPSILARAGFFSGFAGLVLSGSRSVWLALPVIALIYIASRMEKLRIRYVLKTLGILALVLVALYQLPFIKQRWTEAINELRDYTASESVDDPARVSSLGARFEMWRAAAMIIADNPVLGVGPGGYQTTVTAYYHEGGWSKDMTQRNGPHNQYLNAWASRGIAGLVTTALVMLAPWLYCVRVRRNSGFEDVRQLALACMMFIVIFAVTGLSDDSLDKKSMIILYFTTLALLLGQIRHRSRY